MDLSEKDSNRSDRPLTQWRPLNPTPVKEHAESSVDERQNMVEAPSELLASCVKVEIEELDEPVSEGNLPTDTFFVPVASSTRLGVDEPAGRTGLKRKLKLAAVKEEPADVKFSALVEGVVKEEKKEHRAGERWKEPPPLSVDWRRLTRRCASLGESVVGTRLRSLRQRATPEGVRTCVELAFGRAAHLMYVVFVAEDSRLLSDAAITEFFFSDEAVVREALPALRRLHQEEMYQSLLLGVGAFGRLRDRRSALLRRLRREYGELVSVESTAEGSRLVHVGAYFRALWKIVYRRSTDAFDNAFHFWGDLEDTPLVVSLGEFARLTEGEDLDEDEVARSWEAILTEVREVSQRRGEPS